MKKTAFILLTAFFTLSMGTMSYAASAGSERTAGLGVYEFDAALGPASGPGDYDGGLGVNFGAGYTLSEIDSNLQARIDISFYHFNHDFSWGTGTYTRVPFMVSARYYVPVMDKVRAFGQIGLETSIDNYDTSGHQSQNKVDVGITPGAGIELFMAPKISVFALALMHLVSDDYASIQFGVATHF